MMNIIIKRNGCFSRLKNLASILSLLCIIPAVSHAALVSTDSAWGAGSLTTDSESGLQWLDLDLSTDISYNSMLTELSDGGLYAGYRYATASEVGTLFINADIPDVNSGSAANVGPAQDLITLLGATKSFRGVDEIFGITATMTTTGEVGAVSAILDHSYNGGVAFYDANTVSGPVYGLDYNDVSVGNWLVKTAEVPIPSAFILFSSALACLGMLKRKLRS
jgi:hypothetical protein